MIIEPLVLAAGVGPRCCSSRLGRWGQDRGRSPSQERHLHPRLLPTRVSAVPGAGAAGMGAGAGQERGGHPRSSPRPCPASRRAARGCSRRHPQPPASKTDRLWRGVCNSPCRADPSRDKRQQGTLLVFYINSRVLGDKRPNWEAGGGEERLVKRGSTGLRSEGRAGTVSALPLSLSPR